MSPTTEFGTHANPAAGNSAPVADIQRHMRLQDLIDARREGIDDALHHNAAERSQISFDINSNRIEREDAAFVVEMEEAWLADSRLLKHAPLVGTVGGAISGAAAGAVAALALPAMAPVAMLKGTVASSSGLEGALGAGMTAALAGVGVMAYSTLPVWAPLACGLGAFAGLFGGAIQGREWLPEIVKRHEAPELEAHRAHLENLNARSEELEGLKLKQQVRGIDTAEAHSQRHRLVALGQTVAAASPTTPRAEYLTAADAALILGQDTATDTSLEELEARLSADPARQNVPAMGPAPAAR